MFCIYHKDKTFCFSSVAPAGMDVVLEAKTMPPADTLHETGGLSAAGGFDAGEITPANLIEKIGNNKTLWVLSPDPEALFSGFCEQFTSVPTAGGVVENGRGELLMIYRRGWWDLPKGHIEAGEMPLQAAVREIMEETGVRVCTAERLICRTMHFYNDFDRWEMKTTWWYQFGAESPAEPVPQHQEDITRAEWLSGERLAAALSEAYPVVREVVLKLKMEN